MTVDSTSNPSAVPLHIYAHSKIPTIAPGSSKRFLVVIATATNSTETTMNNVRFPFVLTDSSGHELRPVVGYGSVIGNSSAAFGTLRPRASTEMSGVWEVRTDTEGFALNWVTGPDGAEPFPVR